MSFPRSGHELTQELLQRYFGPEFIYSDQYQVPFPNEVHFLKGHDFDLSHVPVPGLRYLVQVRDPFESLYSWHKMGVERGESPDTEEEWREFSRNALEFWTRFVRKWVYVPPTLNRLVVHYADLLENPNETLYRMVQFFGEKPEEDRIRKIVREVVKPRRWAERLRR